MKLPTFFKEHNSSGVILGITLHKLLYRKTKAGKLTGYIEKGVLLNVYLFNINLGLDWYYKIIKGDNNDAE